MKSSIWLYCFIITILLGCSSAEEIQEFPEEIESIIPVTVARKFSGNTLTVSATGIPPLAISLIRKDSTVYSDFLVEPGDVNIHIGTFRQDFGKYQIRVEDAMNRDTSMTIQIDKRPPRRRTGQSNSRRRSSSGRRGSKAITGKYQVIKSEVINHYRVSHIKCLECGATPIFYYGVRSYYYVCQEFPNDLYLDLPVGAREACKKLCSR